MRQGPTHRTVPIPEWVKAALDQWTVAARVTEGRIFRAVARGESVGERHLAECRVVPGRRFVCKRFRATPSALFPAVGGTSPLVRIYGQAAVLQQTPASQTTPLPSVAQGWTRW